MNKLQPCVASLQDLREEPLQALGALPNAAVQLTILQSPHKTDPLTAPPQHSHHHRAWTHLIPPSSQFPVFRTSLSPWPWLPSTKLWPLPRRWLRNARSCQDGLTTEEVDTLLPICPPLPCRPV